MSQATHTHITRRSILAGLGAAIPATAVAAAPVFAAQHPDAELLALGCQWDESAAAIDAVRKAFDIAEERFGEIEIEEPEELFQQPQDMSLGFAGAHERHDGRRWYVCRIDELRTKPRLKQDWSRITKAPNGEHFCVYVADPKAQARADEIVAAYDRWQANIARAEDTSGLTAAKAEDERLQKINRDLCEQILSTPARTVEGLAVKARIYAWFTGGADEVEKDLTSHLETDGPGDQTAMLAIVRDLLKLKNLT
ncbi:hypothetical protein AA309_26550 [Microvirga vignae]|uniref:Uncharacterized protein n=1 Tax=Microvirga vignae TaxID=1225564 RepID=A0A0H1R5J0_9HYPH|nr:hypothetical protein [Microvirga vignae]KLK90294.1 hypothetical protein AA309_26550 [Microvirga vignae]